jgi:hypothetical protein
METVDEIMFAEKNLYVLQGMRTVVEVYRSWQEQF